jgi:HAD superfamily hydrolase (TIGR01549 family)
MDGTLTEPMLDFPLIRSEMGIEGPILEAMAAMSGARLADCQRILQRHEERAAHESKLNAGCRELLALAERRAIATAIITRNSRWSVEIFERRHAVRFTVSVTRDDCAAKPDPRPLLLACERLGVAPRDAWMIGDGRYDVEAARAARIKSVWLSHGREIHFDARPWRVVKDLAELHVLVSQLAARKPLPRGSDVS